MREVLYGRKWMVNMTLNFKVKIRIPNIIYDNQYIRLEKLINRKNVLKTNLNKASIGCNN